MRVLMLNPKEYPTCHLQEQSPIHPNSICLNALKIKFQSNIHCPAAVLGSNTPQLTQRVPVSCDRKLHTTHTDHITIQNAAKRYRTANNLIQNFTRRAQESYQLTYNLSTTEMRGFLDETEPFFGQMCLPRSRYY